MYNSSGEVGLCEGKVFFELQGLPRVETSHFKQVPVGAVDGSGNQWMKILCFDTGVETETFDSVGPGEAPKTEREFHVVSEAAPFFSNGKYPLAERIKNLLVASIETGNPIRWC